MDKEIWLAIILAAAPDDWRGNQVYTCDLYRTNVAGAPKLERREKTIHLNLDRRVDKKPGERMSPVILSPTDGWYWWSVP